MPISKIKQASIDASALTGSNITDGTITAADLATDAVTTAKIASDSITTSKIADTVAFGRRNIVINGAMLLAQRHTGTVTVADTSNEGYATLDRYSINFNNAVGGGLDVSQSSDAPVGFANSMKLKCQTTNTDYTGTKFIELRHKIEARNLQHLCFGTSSAKPITISWYMKTVNYTGPITLSAQTHDGTNEYYVKSVTPTTSWARYTCTIPGSTTATINNDNGLGMSIDFVLAGGSSGTYAASSDSTGFSTTRVDYRNNIGNLLSNTSNEIYITGVQMEVGDTATPFEHRSLGEELALCQRYFYKTYDINTNPGTADGTGAIFSRYAGGVSNQPTAHFYKTTMRTNPSVSVYSLNGTSGHVSDCATGYSHSADDNVGISGTNGVDSWSRLNGVTVTAGDIIGYHFTAEAEL